MHNGVTLLQYNVVIWSSGSLMFRTPQLTQIRPWTPPIRLRFCPRVTLLIRILLLDVLMQWIKAMTIIATHSISNSASHWCIYVNWYCLSFWHLEIVFTPLINSETFFLCSNKYCIWKFTLGHHFSFFPFFFFFFLIVSLLDLQQIMQNKWRSRVEEV